MICFHKNDLHDYSCGVSHMQDYTKKATWSDNQMAFLLDMINDFINDAIV